MVNHFCTADEVKSAINYPSTGAPVTDADITVNIGYAEEEIENIYKTMFGNIDISGTADGDYATTTLSDSGESWTIDEYVGYIVWIYGGTGSGQYSEIQSNTATKLTFNAVTTAPDATSTYRIVKLGYKDETIDGSGLDEMFINYQPLINLNSLTVDSVSVTTTNVFQYKSSGRLLLGSSAEAGTFLDSTPQLVNLTYIYGVYPLPQIIKRLCICIAGVRTLTAQIAGTYNDFTSVSLPGGFTGSKGEPYTNIQASLNFLQGEARGIVYGTQSTGQVSGDMRTQPSYRPFVIFG